MMYIHGVMNMLMPSAIITRTAIPPTQWYIKNGYPLVGSKHAIIFTKRNFKLVCDIKAHTDKKINVCCVSKET
jgi:hypothetical protein